LFFVFFLQHCFRIGEEFLVCGVDDPFDWEDDYVLNMISMVVVWLQRLAGAFQRISEKGSCMRMFWDIFNNRIVPQTTPSVITMFRVANFARAGAWMVPPSCIDPDVIVQVRLFSNGIKSAEWI
jgi:hypothetical protein